MFMGHFALLDPDPDCDKKKHNFYMSSDLFWFFFQILPFILCLPAPPPRTEFMSSLSTTNLCLQAFCKRLVWRDL
jgi:hypothetical protein